VIFSRFDKYTTDGRIGVDLAGILGDAWRASKVGFGEGVPSLAGVSPS